MIDNRANNRANRSDLKAKARTISTKMMNLRDAALGESRIENAAQSCRHAAPLHGMVTNRPCSISKGLMASPASNVGPVLRSP